FGLVRTSSGVTNDAEILDEGDIATARGRDDNAHMVRPVHRGTAEADDWLGAGQLAGGLDRLPRIDNCAARGPICPARRSLAHALTLSGCLIQVRGSGMSRRRSLTKPMRSRPVGNATSRI